jgi:hypothetical protein
MTSYPLTIWTIGSYVEHGYSAHLWCPGCKHWRGAADLPALVAAGHGQKPLREVRLVCAACRQPLDATIHPSPGFGRR